MRNIKHGWTTKVICMPKYDFDDVLYDLGYSGEFNGSMVDIYKENEDGEEEYVDYEGYEELLCNMSEYFGVSVSGFHADGDPYGATVWITYHEG